MDKSGVIVRVNLPKDLGQGLRYVSLHCKPKGTVKEFKEQVLAHINDKMKEKNIKLELDDFQIEKHDIDKGAEIRTVLKPDAVLSDFFKKGDVFIWVELARTQEAETRRSKDFDKMKAKMLASEDHAERKSAIGTPHTERPLRKLLNNVQDLDAYHRSSFNSKLSVDDFELLNVIGKGGFAKVMQVRKRDTGKIYAMKVLKKKELIARKQVAHTNTERKILQDIENPFIVALRFAFQTTTKLYMVLDYFNGGELFFHLKNNGHFPEIRARFYAAEIVLALECMHNNRIIYRDLKPENILLDEKGHIRLTDFGLSKELEEGLETTLTFCGTPEYLAPEVILGQPYGQACDWWSLGTVLYEMITGMGPFYDENLHTMYDKILRAKLTFPPEVSANARKFIGSLLERNPKQRLGSGGKKGVEDIKKHPFFEGLDWVKLYKKELTAPFVPTVLEGKLDVANVDEEFTSERAIDTPLQTGSLLEKATPMGSQAAFPGFTYAGPESQGDGYDIHPALRAAAARASKVDREATL